MPMFRTVTAPASRVQAGHHRQAVGERRVGGSVARQGPGEADRLVDAPRGLLVGARVVEREAQLEREGRAPVGVVGGGGVEHRPQVPDGVRPALGGVAGDAGEVRAREGPRRGGPLGAGGHRVGLDQHRQRLRLAPQPLQQLAELRQHEGRGVGGQGPPELGGASERGEGIGPAACPDEGGPEALGGRRQPEIGGVSEAAVGGLEEPQPLLGSAGPLERGPERADLRPGVGVVRPATRRVQRHQGAGRAGRDAVVAGLAREVPQPLQHADGIDLGEGAIRQAREDHLRRGGADRREPRAAAVGERRRDRPCHLRHPLA
jgi:hypothetical protein